jgi:predicted ABC-type ATPase
MPALLDALPLDRCPLIVAIAGPNGAGKSTFYRLYLEKLGLPYLNADDLARELETDTYEAARLAAETRSALVREKRSFIFETVFSDPVGDKLGFLAAAAAQGYAVVVCFIGLANTSLSEARVVQRVLAGGHDVPTEKLEARFPRTLANLRRAIRELPYVAIYDNSDRDRPFHLVASFENGSPVLAHEAVPDWARELVKAQ